MAPKRTKLNSRSEGPEKDQSLPASGAPHPDPSTETQSVLGPDAGRTCRACGDRFEASVLDLGATPLANSYLSPDQLSAPELFLPLHLFICSNCKLVQLDEMETPDRIFRQDYAYFSSYSDSWLKHAETYAASAIERFGLGPDSLVVEPASNDGYLLQYFHRAGVPVLGVEPAANVADVAKSNGIETIIEFFGEALGRRIATERRPADLVVANNVLAHVPALRDFVKGVTHLLAERGVFTAEFPHLVRLVAGNEYDTIYHEHYSYFTLLTIGRVLRAHGLEVFDVEELTTHGGSLRIYARHRTDLSRPISDAVRRLEARELDGGYDTLEPYRSFSHRVHAAKRNLLKFLIAAKESGRSVVGYGAPAKGTVLLNYCGIGTDFLDYTTDINPHKQGRFMPGVRIPIHPPTRIAETRPDYVLILPWNLREEIMEQHAYISEWGGRFVTPIPDVKVFQPRVGGSAAFGVAFGH